jgi:hypothetical protein
MPIDQIADQSRPIQQPDARTIEFFLDLDRTGDMAWEALCHGWVVPGDEE